MPYFISINLENSTSGYVTLNDTTADQYDLFLTDGSYAVAPQTQKLVIMNSRDDRSSTYNVTENGLLTISWAMNDHQDGWIVSASVSGTSAYTANGFDSPVSTTWTDNDELCYVTYTITVYAT